MADYVVPQTNEVVFRHNPWRELTADFSFARLKKEARWMVPLGLLVSGVAYYQDGKTAPSGLPSWSLGPLAVVACVVLGTLIRAILLYGIAFFARLVVSDCNIGVKEPGRSMVKFGWGEVQDAGIVLQTESALYIQFKLVSGGRQPCAVLNVADLSYFQELALKYGGSKHPLAQVVKTGSAAEQVGSEGGYSKD